MKGAHIDNEQSRYFGHTEKKKQRELTRKLILQVLLILSAVPNFLIAIYNVCCSY